MSIQLLRDIKGLRVLVVHEPDDEGVRLVEHLRRIGCNVEAQWPMPKRMPEGHEVVLLSIDQENRDGILKFVRSSGEKAPMLIGIVGYENPSTLQLVIETGATGIIERPIRPFGLLTNLIIARALWQQQADMQRRIRKLERRLQGVQRIQKAKSILMRQQDLSEDEAYATIRSRAMAKRISIDEMAVAIINADELLNTRAKCD